jgi:hypothetical protein
MSIIKRATLIVMAFLILMSFTMVTRDPWQSKFVQLNADGSLQYTPDEKGNIIPDFSRVGYHQGDQQIPAVKVVKTLEPAKEGDSQLLIQNAIDELSKKLPDKKGLRGTIHLKKGIYKIPGTILIEASGIVLQGEGDSENGTKLIATGKGKRELISVSGSGTRKEIKGSRKKILDNYVPVGAISFEIDHAESFKTGDPIVVYRPGTQEWISDLKMDQIVAREGTKQWQPDEYNLQFERTITKIEGNRIFIDNPIVMTMEAKYGGGEIFKYEFKERISEIGIEGIRFESEFETDTDEDHGWIAIQLNKAEDCWVKNVTSLYFGYSCVSLGEDAKNITVRDSKCLDAKSEITGGRRYSFNNNGQLNLFMNLETTEGRHDYVTGAQTSGPNVFFNCKSSSTHADIGPHHRWATGTLYDNIITDGDINVQDRGNWGSGHGWAGVNQVIWNCTAKKAAVQNPWVSGKNYCIGLKGEKDLGRLSDKPDGEWEGQNIKDLKPESLYLAQLNARKKNKNQ